jgi:hypothetical protein
VTIGQVAGIRSRPRCLYFQIGKSHEDTSLRIRLSVWPSVSSFWSRK